jgi:hypothetical protein
MTLRSTAAALTVFVGATFLASGASSQDTPSPGPTVGASTDPGKRFPIQLRVSGVRSKAGAREVRLSQTIVVTVENLTDWIASNPSSNDPRQFGLYLDGRSVPGSTATPVGQESNELLFDLTRMAESPESRAAWSALLRQPGVRAKAIDITIARPGELPLPSKAQINLRAIDGIRLMGFALALTLVAVLFGRLAARSDILRSAGPPPGGNLRKPFSLGRTQMAVWFFVAIASYVFLWLVIGEADPLTPTVLGLIGISAGTALGAAFVDSSRQLKLETRQKELVTDERKIAAEVSALESGLAELKTQLAVQPTPQNVDDLRKALLTRETDRAAATSRLTQRRAEIAGLANRLQPPVSSGFIQDILSDSDGISFHRFQIFVWTIVLVIVFVSSVYDRLAMPEFSEKLLGLMGISSGTYLGFKFPEQT